MDLGTIMARLYQTAEPFRDYLVKDDGHGQYLAVWNAAKLGPQPTTAELEQKAKELAPQIALAECLEKRRAAYTTESDPLYLGAVYDSLRTDGKNLPLINSDWMAKVMEIKQRLAKPEALK